MGKRPPLTNSGARTSDWIGQTKSRAIYAYDLGALAESAGVRPSTDPNKAAFNLVQKIVAKSDGGTKTTPARTDKKNKRKVR